MADSEGEENTMHTSQPDMVRRSLESTAHPDVYARRKVAAQVSVDGPGLRVANVGDVDVWTSANAVPKPGKGLYLPAGSVLSVATSSLTVVAEVIEPACTCPTSPRDADGNCDLIEQDDCPAHGHWTTEADVEADTLTHERMQRLRDLAASLPDSADTRLHESGMASLGRRREGWRGRLAHVELLLSAAIAPGAIGRPVREFTRGEMADLEMALAEVRAMIDGA